MKKEFVIIFALISFCFGFSSPFSADKEFKKLLASDLPKVFIVDNRYDINMVVGDAEFKLVSADKINIIRKDDFIKDSMWLVGYSVNVEVLNTKPFTIPDNNKVKYDIKNHKATIYCVAKIKSDDAKYKIVGNHINNIVLDKQPNAKELKAKSSKDLKDVHLKSYYNSRMGERE